MCFLNHSIAQNSWGFLLKKPRRSMLLSVTNFLARLRSSHISWAYFHRIIHAQLCCAGTFATLSESFPLILPSMSFHLASPPFPTVISFSRGAHLQLPHCVRFLLYVCRSVSHGPSSHSRYRAQLGVLALSLPFSVFSVSHRILYRNAGRDVNLLSCTLPSQSVLAV